MLLTLVKTKHTVYKIVDTKHTQNYMRDFLSFPAAPRQPAQALNRSSVGEFLA